jgi:hypothetical protein
MDNPIYKYLAQVPGLSGAALCNVITRAIADPATYFFIELYALPEVQELVSSVGSVYDDEKCQQHPIYMLQFVTVNLLKIFTFQTFHEYVEFKKVHEPINPKFQNYITLDQALIKKLKMKSLHKFSLLNETSVVPYSTLFRVLDIHDEVELESLVLDSIYQGCIDGKINASDRIVLLQPTQGFDVDYFSEKDAISRLRTTFETYKESVLQQKMLVQQKLAAILAETTKKQKKKKDAKATDSSSKGGTGKEDIMEEEESESADALPKKKRMLQEGGPAPVQPPDSDTWMEFSTDHNAP